MLDQPLTQAFGQLRLANDPLSEGTVNLLAQDFSPLLKDYIKQAISFAYLQWAALPLAPLPNFSEALKMINIRLGQYFNDPKASILAPLSPSALRKFLSNMLLMILVHLDNDAILTKDVTIREKQNKCIAQFHLLHALLTHEFVTDLCLQNPTPDLTTIRKQILVARNSFKKIDLHPIVYENAELEQELTQLKRVLLHKIYVLECLYIPNTLGFKELQFHINRKNQLATLKQSAYHAELIFNPNTYRQHSVDQSVIKELIEKIKCIKNKLQPRTQFIIDVLGMGHAMVVDVGFNEQSNQIEIICVEPACLGFQADFLTQLSSELSRQGVKNTQTIAIQAGLLKDHFSCYTFSLVLSSEIAKWSLQNLQKQLPCEQPSFLRGHSSATQAPLENVTWGDVTVLGKKVVMMDQSYSEMRMNLHTLLPDQVGKLDVVIEDFRNSYGISGKVEALNKNEANEQSYIHVKRTALQQKTTQDPFSDLTTHNVLAKVKAQTPGIALRRLASGFGAARDMRFLLSKHAEVIDEPSEKTGKTALHFAYHHGKVSRAYHLEKAGASVEAIDHDGKKPRDLLKK